MANIRKYYKGTVESFKEYISELLKKTDEESKKRYEEIFDSIVYISENISKDPEESFETLDGAIYAHGAIIAGGGSPEWEEDDINPIE